MKKIVFFLFFLLPLHVIAHAADSDLPEVRLILEQKLAESKTLLDKGQNEKAWTVLSGLLIEEPGNVDVNLLWVQAASKTGRANQALAALERLVIMHPRDARLRHELARYYAAMGDRTSAQTEMEIVRELDPGIASADTDLALDRAATAGQKRWDRFQMTGRLAAGLIWDSNVNNGLDDLDITVGKLELSMNNGAEKKAALGQYINANLNGGWRLGEDSPWWLVGDVNLYGKNHYIDVPSNQYFAWGRLGLGLRYLSTKNLFDLRIRQEHTMFEPEEYANSSGIEGSWIYAIRPDLQLISKAGIDIRTYMENDNRDGNYWFAGSWLRYLWGRSNANSVMVGARALGAGTREPYHSFEGWEAMARISFSPIERLEFTPFIAYREQYYHDAATRLSAVMGEDNRLDQTWVGGLFTTWHWTENLATEIGWQYTKNNSNSEFYKYDQHQINLGMVFKF